MPRPFERRSKEAPMDYTYDSADRNVYAPGSPFVTSIASSSRSPSFPTPQPGYNQPSFAGGFAGAAGSWNPRSNAMPEPEIADVTMESIDPSSPKKIKSAPSSPQKAQVTNYGSESDEGTLAPLPVVKARKQPYQVRRRPRRATSAPVDEGSESEASAEEDRYAGPRMLSNHYTMHVNAPSAPVQATSPYAPHILLGYVRVIFNTSLILGFLYILVIIIVTVRRDIEDNISVYMGENAAQITQCTSQFTLNKCEKEDERVPHMKQFCDEWARCMKRDASIVGRTRIAAETLAEVVNGFVEPITWKTLGFSVSTLAFLVLFINVSASWMRPAPPPHQPEYQAPPYPYHAPYAVMPPEWGSAGWNEGQGDSGPKMIRASSEVPGQRRSKPLEEHPTFEAKLKRVYVSTHVSSSPGCAYVHIAYTPLSTTPPLLEQLPWPKNLRHFPNIRECTGPKDVEMDILRFVKQSGKGGVGKTTTSCSLAIQLAAVRESVLLISTDPAHNLSDAFGQKFSKEATKVNGFDNLYAMELDPTSSIQEMIEQSDNQGAMGSMMQDLAFAIPGVDEAMGFAEIMKHVKSMEYSVIVFDTAPTGHTLRFLSFPSVLEKALAGIRNDGRAGRRAAGRHVCQIGWMRAIITEVNQQFKDPTERLVQELTTYGIDTHNIVVNQLLFPKKTSDCEHCNVRYNMQQKYLAEAHELYDEFFHIITLPLLTEEVRGPEKLKSFSKMLVEPYVPVQ
ncbi:ATPase GET3 [Rhizoctonia solani]|uniref:ATPase GET3 n=1 Tax=Rhizoctonia solani TaxID=456999 RepID=A0A8H7IJD0_9AGAM|nr:ATPase GET3 [Rhizoctonia solani]